MSGEDGHHVEVIHRDNRVVDDPYTQVSYRLGDDRDGDRDNDPHVVHGSIPLGNRVLEDDPLGFYWVVGKQMVGDMGERVSSRGVEVGEQQLEA